MIHREGLPIVITVFVVLLLINLGFYWLIPAKVWILRILMLVSLLLFVFVMNFFRNPSRPIAKNDPSVVYSPADGLVVAIEECEEPEYFKDKRLKVSVFMSIWNVHLNRVPFDGTINYFKYHEGKFLVAWLPKSSTDNEHTTFVIKNTQNKEILLRQIAGFIARRIATYVKTGDTVKQGDELGFIRFGSRVDLFFPLGTPINVKMNQKVKGNIDVIAKI